jgi:succinate dehydrogenase / fumarate reductase membrane anchor subunit
LTAVYIALFLVPSLALLSVHPPASYAQWRDWLAAPGLDVALALFVAATAVHAYLGLRDILLDYTPEGAVRVVALGLWSVAVAGYMAWGLLWVVSL